MSAAPQTTPQRQLPKVLRIGLVQEGRIVQERLIKAGESVFIGSGPRNTFEITGEKVPARMELFGSKGNNYQLIVPTWVEGMLQTREGVRDLDDLRKNPETARKGEFFVIPVAEDTRGKLVVAGTSILFQFVPAPPEPAKAVTAVDFRPKLIDDEDPLFLGLLAVFSFFAGVFMVWVHFTPLPEVDELADIEDALELIADRIPPPIDVTTTTEPEEDGDKPTEKPKEQTTSKAENTQPKAVSTGDARQDVANRSLLIQAIGMNGLGAGVAADLLGDDDAKQASLDAAINGVSGVQIADASTIGTYKGGTGGGPTDTKVNVGSVGGGGTGAKTGTGTVALKAKVASGGEDYSIDEGDAGSVGGAIKRYAGKIQACTETALKANPALKGRISVSWQIVAGQVKGVSIISNGTGDTALGECVARSVRQFRFDQTVTGNVDQYTWIVSAQ